MVLRSLVSRRSWARSLPDGIVRLPVEVDDNGTVGGNPGADRRRSLRRDAAANRERLLDAAAVAVLREGEGVPIATIAAAAGLGVGTLYRHFPTREALLAAVGHRSFRIVLGHARLAAAAERTAIASVGAFLERIIADRDNLVLPLHGGPLSLDDETERLRAEIRATIGSILLRGGLDGTIRTDVTAEDVIITGALLAQPLPHVSDWDVVARRQAQIYVSGLAPDDARPLRSVG